MDAIETERRYFKIIRSYLSIVGIWPYQRKYSQYFIRTIVYVVMVSCILAQVSYVVCFFTIETLTNELFMICTCSIALIKHYICAVKGSKFKVLLDGMVEDLESDRAKEELTLMTPYMNRAVFMATAYSYGTMSVAAIFVQMPLLPLIADIIVPLNTSRPRANAMELHYFFIDTDEHSLWTMLHVNISVLITAIASVGCDTFYIYTVLHACGLFEVAGYRFRRAIGNSGVRGNTAMSKEMYKKVGHSIKAHERAIRYVREIDDVFSGILFIAVGITVIALSSSLFWVSRLELSEAFYMHLISLLTGLWHIFFLTFMGHFVINKTDAIYEDIYDGQWYNREPRTQALFILALRAAIDPPQITAGGVLAMNLQTFAQVVKVSFSYFTVLRSA